MMKFLLFHSATKFYVSNIQLGHTGSLVKYLLTGLGRNRWLSGPAAELFKQLQWEHDESTTNRFWDIKKRQRAVSVNFWSGRIHEIFFPASCLVGG